MKNKKKTPFHTTGNGDPFQILHRSVNKWDYFKKTRIYWFKKLCIRFFWNRVV